MTFDMSKIRSKCVRPSIRICYVLPAICEHIILYFIFVFCGASQWWVVEQYLLNQIVSFASVKAFEIQTKRSLAVFLDFFYAFHFSTFLAFVFNFECSQNFVFFLFFFSMRLLFIFSFLFGVTVVNLQCSLVLFIICLSHGISTLNNRNATTIHNRTEHSLSLSWRTNSLLLCFHTDFKKYDFCINKSCKIST